MLAPWYAIYFEKLDRVVMRHGWNMTIHGSLQRDLDLVMIPWTEDAEPEEKVLDAIEKFIKGGPYFKESTKNKTGWHPTIKPHGRKAYSIYVGFNGAYLDISVMPRIESVK